MNSAQPSPWATTISSNEPCMSLRKIDGFCRGPAPSLPALRTAPVRTNPGQRSAPGDLRCRFGHHLATVAHAKRETVFACEERTELVARAGIEEDGLGPALAGAEHIAEGRVSAGGGEALESFNDARPLMMSLMVTSTAAKPAVEGRGHFRAGRSPLLAQDGDAAAWRLCRCRAAIFSSGSKVGCALRPGSAVSSSRSYSSCAHVGLSRSDCIRNVVSDQARCRFTRET